MHDLLNETVQCSIFDSFEPIFTMIKMMIFLQFLFLFEIGNFPLKIGKKDTFWHWEYNQITAIKLAKNKPCFPRLFHSGIVFRLRWSISRLLRSYGHSQKIFLVLCFSSKFQICTPWRNDQNLIEPVIRYR